jgi:putative endonuclease
MGWVVYILRCADETLYTGITNDLAGRLAAHAAGTGAKYTRGRGPFCVMLEEQYQTRSEASKRELAIKKLSRSAKTALCGQKKKSRKA